MSLTPTATAIAALDIEAFSRRPEREQGLLRDSMYAVTESVVQACGLDWDQVAALDRGDSIILLLPPTLSPVVLVTTFVTTLDERLRDQARTPGAPEMRLRLALGVGFASADLTGWVGNSINHACRLLDLDSLRRVLAETRSTRLAVVLADELHRVTVAQGHGGLDPGVFHRVPVRVKELDTVAWIHVPGHPVPAGLPSPEPEPAQAADGQAVAPPATHHSEGAMFNGPVTVSGGTLIGRDGSPR